MTLSMQAPLTLTLSDIITNNPASPRAEAAVTQAGRVLAVGSADDLRSQYAGARQVDRRGQVLTPGLCDAHIHLVGYGFTLSELSLHGVRSVPELQRLLAERVAATPAGEWIRGGGFLLSELGLDAYPSAQWLDEVSPNHPVALSSRDTHMVWANSLALRLAGIDAGTPNPVGGQIVQPLGCLLEFSAIALLERAIPEPSPAQYLAAARAGAADLHSRGYTSIHTMAMENPQAPAALQELSRLNELPLRVWACLPHDRLHHARELGLGGTGGGAMFQWGGVKFFADGALGSRTAYLHEPGFADGSGTGMVLDSPELITERSREALEMGLTPVTHAIGDRAIHEVLQAYAPLRPLARDKGLRLRIEHVQHLDLRDLPQLEGVVVGAQPIHLGADAGIIRQLLPQHLRSSYAFKSLQSAGAVLAFGSDAPVAMPDVQGAFAAAMTRLGDDGAPLAPAEAMTAEEVLWAFTRGPALAAGWNDEGWVVPGARAAFTVWDSLGGAARPVDWL